MENTAPTTKKLNFSSLNTRLIAIILTVALIGGIGTGFFLASSPEGQKNKLISLPNEKPKSAQQDTRTFRDSAKGKVTKKPESQTYAEGTHLLVREGAVPVALTSSVVDLTQYEGKEVEVFGETQKALKEGWLMDVGKVEVK